MRHELRSVMRTGALFDGDRALCSWHCANYGHAMAALALPRDQPVLATPERVPHAADEHQRVYDGHPRPPRPATLNGTVKSKKTILTIWGYLGLSVLSLSGYPGLAYE